MQTTKTHWASLLILIVLGLGIFVFLLIAFGSFVASMIDLFKQTGDPAGKMITAFTFVFETMVLIFCSWFVLQKTMGRERADLPFIFPFASWQIAAIIGTVTLALIIGGIVAAAEISWLAWVVLPLLTLLVIVPPLWLLFGLGSRGIELGSRWRVFGVIGLSMTVGPLIMIVLELVILLGIILVGAAIIAIAQPAFFQELLGIVKTLRNETNPDLILDMVGPYLSNPVVIATMLSYIALIVPLIEELFKPLAVWVFATKIESPAQGFAMGVLCGAAFALIESLNASADGSSSWPFIVGIRAATGLLHMTTSGIVGWGVVSAVREKHILRFFGAYFAAVTLHGIWNACALGTGISSIGESIGKPEWMYNYIPAFICGMLVLGFGMFAVLIASNRKLRSSPVPSPLKMENIEEGVK